MGAVVGDGLELPRGVEGPVRLVPVRVLCVGTVKAWKRPELARAAARALPDVAFTWIGEGEALEAERAAAPGNLAFPGACDRATLPDRYRDADVFLHPGRREGLPKVVLEAMASGLPVVAWSEWRPDFLAQGGAGLVVGEEREMVEALRALRDEPSRRAAMGEAARRWAGAYGWDEVARRWERVFEREGGRGGSSRG